MQDTAKCDRLPEAEALVHVIEKGIDEHVFGLPLEFERLEYKIRQGSRKKLKLFAKYPDLIANETEIKVYSSDDEKAAVRGRCILTPVADSNYAVGEVTVEGRKLKSKSTIIAEVHGRTAEASIKVIDKRELEPQIPIKFEIRDEDYGNFRARWAEAEGKPHLLLISAKHKSVARYLAGDKICELLPPVNRFVDKSSHLMSDENHTFRTIGNQFAAHDWVNHSHKEYARGNIHNNTAESFSSILERAKQGVFHYLRTKHLNRYLHEIGFRWDHRIPQLKLTKKVT